LHSFSHTLAENWSRSGVRWFAVAADRVVVVGDNKLCEVSAKNGAALSCVDGLGDALAAPVVLSDGAAVVEPDGVRLVLSGELVAQTLSVGGAPLFAPIYDADRAHLYVVARGGRLTAVDLSTALSPRERASSNGSSRTDSTAGTAAR
jgi:hypothetical protein